MRISTKTRAKKPEAAGAAKSPKPRASRAASRSVADVRITHPERIVFPDTTITKGDVAAYYAGIIDWLLPEIAARPLSIIRCPDGAGATCFFQKHHADKLGAHVGSILLKEKTGSDRYLHVGDPEGVLELVQMNAIEFHPWGSRIDEPEKPDRLVFDLDPAPGIGWSDLVAAAKDVRTRVRAHGLESFPRLTGGKGLHVVVPIRRRALWDEAKSFCERIAEEMAREEPERYLAHASKSAREGRIFVDWLRNARGATSVASFSLRARAGAPVAMPVRWEDLARLGGANAFDLAAALKRVKAMRRHPWGDFAKTKQTLPRARTRR
jgi:bifunctional non-homologous end joining protein LigD